MPDETGTAFRVPEFSSFRHLFASSFFSSEIHATSSSIETPDPREGARAALWGKLRDKLGRIATRWNGEAPEFGVGVKAKIKWPTAASLNHSGGTRLSGDARRSQQKDTDAEVHGRVKEPSSIGKALHLNKMHWFINLYEKLIVISKLVSLVVRGNHQILQLFFNLRLLLRSAKPKIYTSEYCTGGWIFNPTTIIYKKRIWFSYTSKY